MSVYGQGIIEEKETVNLEGNILENYIENNFLESRFNENAVALRAQIATISENSEIEEFSTVMNSVLEADIPASTKILLATELCERAKISSSLGSYDEYAMESVVLEYSGDPEKNREFIAILNDLEEYINASMDYLKELAKYADEELELVEEMVKKPITLVDNYNKIKTHIDIINKFYDERFKKINGTVTFNEFKSKVNKFNNKYSEITMEEKKKLHNKILPLFKEMNSLVHDWAKNGRKIEKIDYLLVELKKLDFDIERDTERYFGSLYNHMFNIYTNNWNFVYYILNALNVKFEDSLRYKFVQKFLKK